VDHAGHSQPQKQWLIDCVWPRKGKVNLDFQQRIWSPVVEFFRSAALDAMADSLHQRGDIGCLMGLYLEAPTIPTKVANRTK